MKNLKGEEIDIIGLKDWEKAVLLQLVLENGVPEWAKGNNFYRLLAALCSMTEDQAQEALRVADEEAARTTALTVVPSEEPDDSTENEENN